MIKCNIMTLRLIPVMILFSLLASCNSNPEKNNRNTKPGKNEMADLNRYLVQKDRERIQNYIERKNLKMTESPTGLWYCIIKEGKGNRFTDSDKVTFGYECSLLDGTRCYSSEKTGPKKLILGKSEMESGMNEGLRLLKPGAEAVFIIPPFLAYGLIGDRKMIPPRAIIVYNVNILQAR
jgi:FKBP-type peptidyl-prolyl cis-trans isomerase FkpA